MLTISLTKFSRNINKYLTFALTEDIFVRSQKYGQFKINPLSEEEAAKLLTEHTGGDVQPQNQV